MEKDIHAPSRFAWLARANFRFLILAALTLIYLSGIVVRMRSGIRVVVENENDAILRNVILSVEKGPSYSLGEITPGKKKSAFVHPHAESSIRLEFADASGIRHSTLVAGYVEYDYCGEVAARILSDFSVQSRDKSFALLNWKSWYGFM